MLCKMKADFYMKRMYTIPCSSQAQLIRFNCGISEEISRLFGVILPKKHKLLVSLRNVLKLKVRGESSRGVVVDDEKIALPEGISSWSKTEVQT